MKTLIIMASAFALVFGAISGANAASVTKSEITSILEERGFNVQDFSNQDVMVDVQGYKIIITIDGPDGDVTYRTWLNGVSSTDLGYKFLNNFNNEVKFGRAYIDRDGDVTIQMDRNSAGGVSAENIESDFDVFLMLVSKFLSDLEAQAVA